ncbi:hypothetical protein O181_120216 [Austropuccinia psidii MF-1]|uniref:Uncharacterized protein n=1 Tax=Austropuccinia psidii MF-1 TaxID=1389203 RepID=A0A9Q3KH85_9BASI|nr:hypothetical protein [Austropuccinia psidii MF-1]
MGPSGPNCGLVPTGLAPCPLLAKGCLNGPTECRPCVAEAIGGLNGPKPPNQMGWARGPGDGWRLKRPTRPKISGIDLGFVEVELVKKARKCGCGPKAI